MRTLLMPLSGLLLLNGCIIIDGEFSGDDDWEDDWCDEDGVCWDEDGDGLWDDEDGEDSAVDTGAPNDTSEPEEPADPFGFALSPNTGAQGQTLFVSLTAVDAADLAKVEDIRFFGDLHVVDTRALDGEILLAVYVHKGAQLGPADLLVGLNDGSAAWVEDAFVVTPGEPASECP